MAQWGVHQDGGSFSGSKVVRPVVALKFSPSALLHFAISERGTVEIDIGGSDAIIMGGRRGGIGSKNSALCLRSLALSLSLIPEKQ